METTANIQTDSAGNSFILIDGKRVAIGSDFTTKSIGMIDVVSNVVNQFHSTAVGKFVTSFSESLQKGDKTSIIIASTVVIGSLFLLYNLMSTSSPAIDPHPKLRKKGHNSSEGSTDATSSDNDTEDEIQPRDFTVDQLREFDGSEGKSIYIGLKREVFDVSQAKDFYGEGSGYHCFAGREASRAMALLSFDESELANPKTDDLGAFGRGNLDDWYEKFKHYKSYPVVGKVSFPPTDLKLTRAELKDFVGTGPIPEDRVDAPIYMGLCGKIFDVSYGGKEMYARPDGPYSMFVGIDASRALAKMSFLPDDLNNHDLSDLTEEELEVLKGWEKKFLTVKKYPVVGKLID